MALMGEPLEPYYGEPGTLPQISPALANAGMWQTLRPQFDIKPPSDPDWMLAWVEENWLMIAASLGGLILFSMMGKRR